MIRLDNKQKLCVPFGFKEGFIWFRWTLVSCFALILYMPVLVMCSLPKVLRYNHMFIVFWFCLGLDWYLKRYFSLLLSSGNSIEVIPGLFSLTLVFNKGAAFGLLKGWGWLFVGLAMFTCVFILVYLALYREKDRLVCWALVFILSGAIGNMIDRIQFEHVIDYLFFYYGNWHFPVFNFADVVINIGVGLICLDVVRDMFRKRDELKAVED